MTVVQNVLNAPHKANEHAISGEIAQQALLTWEVPKVGGIKSGSRTHAVWTVLKAGIEQSGYIILAILGIPKAARSETEM